MKPITESQLSSWNESFRNDQRYQLASWALSKTKMVNQFPNQNLKVCAIRLWKLAAEHASEEALQAEKNAMLAKIYQYQASCYGEPPRIFSFEYVDKKEQYHL